MSGYQVEVPFHGKGGAGGNIVNSYGISITSDINYSITIAAGGVGSEALKYITSNRFEEKHNPGGQGGTTSFLSITATGGNGATATGGVGTSSNGGNGGAGAATGTEFDDGSTYYSGGGANGVGPSTIAPSGGAPYGGNGGYVTGSSPVAGGNGKGPGGGGGGGNGSVNQSSHIEYLTKGGNGASGLVAIRFHF